MTKTIARRYRGAGPGRQEGDPGRAVRTPGVAPGPRPQGAAGGPEGQDRPGAQGAAADLRRGRDRRAAVLLGGDGHRLGQADGPVPGWPRAPRW